jgi:hypothetical protein
MCAQNVTGEFWPGLGDLLERLRPWVDEETVERKLRAGARRRGWPTESDAGDGVAEIARTLRELGGTRFLRTDGSPDWNRRPPTPAEAVGIVVWMFRDIAAGGEPGDGSGFNVVRPGFLPPPSTMRRYRQKYGAAALEKVMQRVERRAAVARALREGRKANTGRVRLLRHRRRA